jgi:hypothetical protein
MVAGRESAAADNPELGARILGMRWIEVSVTLIGHMIPNSPCTNRYWKAYLATGCMGHRGLARRRGGSWREIGSRQSDLLHLTVGGRYSIQSSSRPWIAGGTARSGRRCGQFVRRSRRGCRAGASMAPARGCRRADKERAGAGARSIAKSPAPSSPAQWATQRRCLRLRPAPSLLGLAYVHGTPRMRSAAAHLRRRPRPR